MSSPARPVAVALVVLVAFVGPGAAAQSAAGPAVDGDGGHHFDVGNEDGPRIEFWVHLDLLTNLGAAGDLGFSAVGTAMDTRVVVLDVQLNFRGVGPLGEFLSDPFSRFAVTAEWELNLPFLSTGPAADDDFTYRDNETIGGDGSGNSSAKNEPTGNATA